MTKTAYRSIFVSDVHLGTKGSKAEELLDFLKHSSCENLYIVGDFVDLWALKRRTYFPQSHVDVIRKVLKRAAQGVNVVYLPGNHDERVREFIPISFGNVSVVDECIHETADGKRYLVLHGDAYDQVVKYAKWVAWLGDIGYTLLLKSNGFVNAFRRRLGLPYWSLSAYVKHRVKSAVNFIGNFEEAVARSVSERGVDGVICGHIHHAEMRQFGNVHYVNDGDWVESCTALVEHFDGRLEIVDWMKIER